MNSVPTRGAVVNAAAERELLINHLRLATARSRMITNLLETVGVSLKHRQVDVEAAMSWLKEEGCLDLLDFGPHKAEAKS